MFRYKTIFLLCISSLCAAPDLYERIGDAPEDADLYEVLDRPGLYFDLKTIPNDLQGKVVKNSKHTGFNPYDTPQVGHDPKFGKVDRKTIKEGSKTVDGIRFFQNEAFAKKSDNLAKVNFELVKKNPELKEFSDKIPVKHINNNQTRFSYVDIDSMPKSLRSYIKKNRNGEFTYLGKGKSVRARWGNIIFLFLKKDKEFEKNFAPIQVFVYEEFALGYRIGTTTMKKTNTKPYFNEPYLYYDVPDEIVNTKVVCTDSRFMSPYMIKAHGDGWVYITQYYRNKQSHIKALGWRQTKLKMKTTPANEYIILEKYFKKGETCYIPIDKDANPRIISRQIKITMIKKFQ